MHSKGQLVHVQFSKRIYSQWWWKFSITDVWSIANHQAIFWVLGGDKAGLGYPFSTSRLCLFETLHLKKVTFFIPLSHFEYNWWRNKLILAFFVNNGHIKSTFESWVGTKMNGAPHLPHQDCVCLNNYTWNASGWRSDVSLLVRCIESWYWNSLSTTVISSQLLSHGLGQ